MIEIPVIELLNEKNREELSLDFVPKTFDDYLGQDELKQKLSIYTQAALMRNEPLDHLLLFGPPGLGKTTLSTIMASVLQVDIKICSGPLLERTGDLVAILSSLQPRDILFIDEIHRMPTAVEEVLYSAMEQFRIDVIIGQGAGARTVNLPISPFTLIGATTKSGMISAPLRSRFGISERLEFYDVPTLTLIVEQNARHLGLQIETEGAKAVAQRARGTPRIAKKLLRRVRDFVQVEGHAQASYPLVHRALTAQGLDNEGLTSVDQLIIKKMIEHFNGGPVGLETIAAMIGEDADTIENVYEPYLLRQGYLEKTPRGRQIPCKMLPLLKERFLGQKQLF